MNYVSERRSDELCVPCVRPELGELKTFGVPSEYVIWHDMIRRHESHKKGIEAVYKDNTW